jgi:hypothetical protein
MKSTIRLGIALASLAVAPVFSQVQLFEQDLSGLVPYLGVRWNQSVIEAQGGVEYNIEGRSVLGFSYIKPLSDTLNWDKSASYTSDKPSEFALNPYAEFEFIEPGSLSNFSFSIRGDMVWENLMKSDENLNNFRRIGIGAGPMFAIRSWVNDRFAIIPTLGYQFFYVSWQKDMLTNANGTDGEFTKGEGVAHDIRFTCPFYYKLNEFHGLSFEPKAIVKLGEGRSSKDLVNVHFQVGYVWTN